MQIDMSSIFWRRLYAGITSPWTIGFSVFGAAYGVYNIIDATQSGEKYDLEEDLSGKTFIVTGATSGIGRTVTEELARRNARVVMACRNREKCIQERRNVVLRTRNKHVYCRQCDLSDPESIRTFASKIAHGKFELDRIDGILHNAATMEPERKVNKDGVELTLATNYLGSFLLTALLLDKLLAQQNPVRVVFVNSNVISHKCNINFDDLNSENRKKWDGYEIYKESKLAQAMFAKELAERVKGTNLTVTVADPGRTKTNLTAKTNAQLFFLSRWILRPVSFFMGERRVEKAVRPVLYALADKNMADANGVFIDRERKEQPWCEEILDKNIRERLWLTGVKWSRLGEHFAQMQKELQEAAKLISDSSLSEKSKETRPQTGRSWRTLWLY